MSLYCLCEAQNDKPDSQHFGAPNRYAAACDQSDFPPLALKMPMRCIKTGAMQVLLNEPHKVNDWTDAGRPRLYSRHFPNVDVYECPVCHARVVKE